MYENPQRCSTKYALYLNWEVIVFDDNTLPERNLSSIVSDSALKMDYSKFLKNQQFYQFLSKHF